MNKAIRIALLGLFGLGFGVFFAPVVIYGVFNLGNIFGMLVFGALFFAVLRREQVKAVCLRVWRRSFGKALALFLAAVLLAGTVTGGVIGLRIVRAANNAPPEGETYTVVVLGCRVFNSGPSRMLWSRINAAYSYLTAHPDAACVLSGGQGDDEFDALTQMGIAPERLILEDESESTRENLAFSMEKIRARGLSESIVLVTSEYHQYRASLFAKEAGFAECYAASGASQLILLPTYFLREIFGVLAFSF